MALYFDTNDSSILKQVAALPPVQGICVFVDIVGSTLLKDEGILKWATAISNAFSNIKVFFHPALVPLKCLGDSLMFFIPDTHLAAVGADHLGLYAGLVNAVREAHPAFPELKGSICHCREAYELTFLRGFADVYGKDIDLTARLAALAEPREIVMNEDFVMRLRNAFGALGNREMFPEVDEIVGPWPEHVKGFHGTVNIYKLPSQQ